MLQISLSKDQLGGTSSPTEDPHLGIITRIRNSLSSRSETSPPKLGEYTLRGQLTKTANWQYRQELKRLYRENPADLLTQRSKIDKEYEAECKRIAEKTFSNEELEQAISGLSRRVLDPKAF